MMNNNYVVIMAGGIGSRFWPYSRNSYPKQFHDVMGTGRSLLQMTYDRFLSVAPKENIYVVSNDMYRDLIKDQLTDLTDDQILLEPNRRNTAPCIAYASYKISQRDPGAKMVVTPSDHAIFNDQSFYHSINRALDYINDNDNLVTIGIQPNRPETRYGYLQYYYDDPHEVKKVKTFTEKPQIELAQKFIESGDFVWNSGIFIWKAKAIIKAFEEHLPEISEIFENIEEFYTAEEVDAIRDAYSQCKNISIDYGVMEKAGNVYVVLGDFSWSDLGSWNSLHDIKEKDENNNVIDANALVYDSHNNLVKAEKNKLVVVQGLNGFIVADYDDVVLICEKDKEDMFRQFISDAKSKKGSDYV